MSARDAFPRITPFELGFPDPGFAEERFHEMAEEARVREMEAGELASFLLLAQVGRTLQDLRGKGDPKELLPTFGAFLFHSFHFHREGHPFYLVETATIRYLLEAGSAPSSWRRTLPHPAGYLQLPRHLAWTRPGGDEGPAEALDGVFWSLAPSGLLHLLAITGIRRGRAGFSVLPVPPLPLPEAEAWMTRNAREDGRDFATTLPGGELERLYSLETAGELVKLAVRILAHADTVPGAVEPERGASPDPGASPESATSPESGASSDPSGSTDPGEAPTADAPSRLPARRIRIGE